MNPIAIKLKFAISPADFRSMQKPFRPPLSKTRTWRAITFGLIAAGLFVILRALPPESGNDSYFFGDMAAGSFLILVGVAVVALLYFLDRRNARIAAQNFEAGLNWAYQKLHCRDERFFECDSNGFTFSCACGTISRPWKQLTGLTENSNIFALLIGGQLEVLPKSAFATEAERTEFRRACSEIVDRDRPVTAPSISYAPTVNEYRAARVLNFIKAGGWRAFLKVYAILAAISLLLAALWSSWAPLPVGVVLMAMTTVMALRGQRDKKWYVGQLSITFDERCLYVQDTVSLMRTPWEEFLGYVENEQLYLLYRNPKLYRMIPRRAFGPKESEFQSVLHRRIPPYNYRKPIAVRAEAPPA